MTGYAEIAGLLSLAVGIAGNGVYIASILRGQTRPHFYTWLVWGLLTAIGYFAQVHDNAGPGSWALGITALACLVILALSTKYGEKNFTRGDKIALASSLMAIVPWLLTDDPLGSVILISLIDLVAFYPTFRKSWYKPHEENLAGYNIANVKFLLSFPAMHSFTLTTLLYPIVCVLINYVFIGVCLWRRHHYATA